MRAKLFFINLANLGSDIQIDLTITYPRSALVVNDEVTISGLAIVNTYPPGYDINSMTIGFENSQTFPVAQTNGITNESDLFLNRIGNTNEYSGQTNCTWEIEGTYHALFGFNSKNSTGNYNSATVESPNVAITVYSQTVLAQIITNNVSIILTIAILILTIIGTFSLILTLWDRPKHIPKSQGSTEKNNPTTNAKGDKIDSKEERKTEGVQKKNNTEEINNNPT